MGTPKGKLFLKRYYRHVKNHCLNTMLYHSA